MAEPGSGEQNPGSAAKQGLSCPLPILNHIPGAGPSPGSSLNPGHLTNAFGSRVLNPLGLLLTTVSWPQRVGQWLRALNFPSRELHPPDTALEWPWGAQTDTHRSREVIKEETKWMWMPDWRVLRAGMNYKQPQIDHLLLLQQINGSGVEPGRLRGEEWCWEEEKRDRRGIIWG